MADDPSRWADRAACRGQNIHLVPERAKKTRHGGVPRQFAAQIAAAKAVCATCPVLEQCRAWAVEAAEDPVPHHVAGGLMPAERAKARRQVHNSSTYGPVARRHGVMATARTCTCWECAERLHAYKRLKAQAQARRREQYARGELRIEHGTYSGYKQHQYQQTPYCEPCRLAYCAYQREYRRRRRQLVMA